MRSICRVTRMTMMKLLRLINILQSQLSPSMSYTAWLVCTKTTQLLWLTWVYASYRTCLATSLPKLEPHYSPISHPRGFFGFTLLTCTIPTQQLKILDQLHFPTPFYYQTFLNSLHLCWDDIFYTTICVPSTYARRLYRPMSLSNGSRQINDDANKIDMS